ncbi:Protein of unknown function [Chitinophaga costaii]|uniref:DUF3667 domain-containing protein n=1 Tax=Chitinophaga costaii TaxID=1335309 RepID=A0A1C4E9F4_9BACT|nr:DUF3667 domain-containing protein [Chitinophaga costaii]SCC40239.1 Protein of unknown function [Chitinophaga costaii]
MSNNLRHDKNCLNCGHEVPERYCGHCGQENIQPHETFGHLVHHFAADVVHYDSKFHTSIQYLLFRPGRLTKEYLAGKRVSFINPIRLYIFVSFVFFFTAFAITQKEEAGQENETGIHPAVLAQVRDSVINGLRQDGLEISKDEKVYPLADKVGNATAKLNLDTTVAFGKYNTVAQYDSAQAALPEAQRDTRRQRWTNRRIIYLKGKYAGANFPELMAEIVQHNGPKVMFLLLPLFALLLKSMYNWKRWYYADHAIFSIHLHSFWFLLILVVLLLNRIFDTGMFNQWGILLGFVYLVAALHNNYQQGWMKSLLKAGALTITYFMAIVFVIVAFVFLLLGLIL